VSGATRIQVCGRLVVEIDGERVEAALRGRQGRLLLAYLVLHRDRPVRRDELQEAAGVAAPAPALWRLRSASSAERLQGRAELTRVRAPEAEVEVEQARAGDPGTTIEI